MRKLIVAAFISLDGVMQAPGGPDEDRSGGFAFGGWTVPHSDEVTGAFVMDEFAEPFDLVLGRRTYDIFAGYWPHHTTGEEGPIGRMFDAATKYVATHRADGLAWRNTERLGGDLAEAVARLKAGDGRVLLTQGSSELVQQLLAADLVDELRLLTFPVLLGKGKRLFGDDAGPSGLALTSSTVSPKGVVMTVHRRAGPVETGSFT